MSSKEESDSELSSDEESDSEEDVDMEEGDVARIMVLESELESAPNSYDKHVEVSVPTHSAIRRFPLI
jgi:hypothetical protein